MGTAGLDPYRRTSRPQSPREEIQPCSNVSPLPASATAGGWSPCGPSALVAVFA